MEELNAEHQTAGIEHGSFLVEDLLVYVVHEIAAANVLLGWLRLERGIRDALRSDRVCGGIDFAINRRLIRS